MTDIDALAEFLLARYDEDEEVARATIGDDQRVDAGHWSTVGMDECRIEGVDMTIYDEGGHTAEQARHIARFDPARVLADIKAKRRVVEECRALDAQTCDCCAYGRADDMLRALASPYATHHDYRQEWKP